MATPLEPTQSLYATPVHRAHSWTLKAMMTLATVTPALLAQPTAILARRCTPAAKGAAQAISLAQPSQPLVHLVMLVTPLHSISSFCIHII